MRPSTMGSECDFLDNRWLWPRKAGATICAIMSDRPTPAANSWRTRPSRPRASPLSRISACGLRDGQKSETDATLGLRVLSAKRRLCNTMGGRLIDGVARCCVVSTARSRAAATTNLARLNQSLVLRALFGRTEDPCVRQHLHDLPPMVVW